MDDHDEIKSHEHWYKITPEGSEFYHCTPNCLGPSSSRILALDYSQMILEGLQVDYFWISYDGICAPRLILKLCSHVNKSDISFSIICHFDLLPPDLSSSTLHKPLPDINAFTPFSESYCSLEIEHYFHQFGDDDHFVSFVTNCDIDSTITLKTKDYTLKINCFTIEFKFDN